MHAQGGGGQTIARRVGRLHYGWIPRNPWGEEVSTISRNSGEICLSLRKYRSKRWQSEIGPVVSIPSSSSFTLSSPSVSRVDQAENRVVQTSSSSSSSYFPSPWSNHPPPPTGTNEASNQFGSRSRGFPSVLPMFVFFLFFFPFRTSSACFLSINYSSSQHLSFFHPLGTEINFFHRVCCWSSTDWLGKDLSFYLWIRTLES